MHNVVLPLLEKTYFAMLGPDPTNQLSKIIVCVCVDYITSSLTCSS